MGEKLGACADGAENRYSAAVVAGQGHSYGSAMGHGVPLEGENNYAASDRILRRQGGVQALGESIVGDRRHPKAQVSQAASLHLGRQPRRGFMTVAGEQNEREVFWRNVGIIIHQSTRTVPDCSVHHTTVHFKSTF